MALVGSGASAGVDAREGAQDGLHRERRPAVEEAEELHVHIRRLAAEALAAAKMWHSYVAFLTDMFSPTFFCHPFSDEMTKFALQDMAFLYVSMVISANPKWIQEI